MLLSPQRIIIDRSVPHLAFTDIGLRNGDVGFSPTSRHHRLDERRQVPMIVAVMTAQLLELNHDGKIRILALTTEQRIASAPEIPTAAESGMPDLKIEVWFSLFAPTATPDAIIDRLAQATRAVMSDTELLQTYRAAVFEPDADSTPEKAQKIVEIEVARLSPLIKSIGLKLE